MYLGFYPVEVGVDKESISDLTYGILLDVLDVKFDHFVSLNALKIQIRIPLRYTSFSSLFGSGLGSRGV